MLLLLLLPLFYWCVCQMTLLLLLLYLHLGYLCNLCKNLISRDTKQALSGTDFIASSLRKKSVVPFPYEGICLTIGYIYIHMHIHKTLEKGDRQLLRCDNGKLRQCCHYSTTSSSKKYYLFQQILSIKLTLYYTAMMR